QHSPYLYPHPSFSLIPWPIQPILDPHQFSPSTIMPGTSESRYVRLEGEPLRSTFVSVVILTQYLQSSAERVFRSSCRIPAGIYISINVDSRRLWKSAIGVGYYHSVKSSHSSPALSVEISAPFELGRMLGGGEVIGELQILWDELLDHGDEPFDIPFPPVFGVKPSLKLKAAIVHACDDQDDALFDTARLLEIQMRATHNLPHIWFWTSVRSAIQTMQQLSPTSRGPALKATSEMMLKTSMPPLPSSATPLHCVRSPILIIPYLYIMSPPPNCIMNYCLSVQRLGLHTRMTYAFGRSQDSSQRLGDEGIGFLGWLQRHNYKYQSFSASSGFWRDLFATSMLASTLVLITNYGCASETSWDVISQTFVAGRLVGLKEFEHHKREDERLHLGTKYSTSESSRDLTTHSPANNPPCDDGKHSRGVRPPSLDGQTSKSAQRHERNIFKGFKTLLGLQDKRDMQVAILPVYQMMGLMPYAMTLHRMLLSFIMRRNFFSYCMPLMPFLTLEMKSFEMRN
ncbi:hypothetical protein C8R48DRAFT_813337, partial [Suillus tomentosus]